MSQLSSEDLIARGFTFGGEVMGNSELRVRCIHLDGSGYIRTESPSANLLAWQNAHYHKGIRETYIVQQGRMAFASGTSGLMTVRLLSAGDVITAIPGQQHNVYLFEGTVIHTVKDGISVGNPEKGGADWYPATEDFDRLTKSLSEEDIMDGQK